MSYDPVVLVLAFTLCVGFLSMLGLVFAMAKILFSAGETERLEKVMRARRASTPPSVAEQMMATMAVPHDTDTEAKPKSLWTRVD
jgi:hypothetical protein